MNARDLSLPLPPDDNSAIGAFAARLWDEEIVPAMTRYIAIPAKSPMFDADWEAHGHIDQVLREAAAWVEGCKVAGLKLEVIRLPGRTPVIFFEVPATKADCTDTVLLYGHLDKQPEFNGWRNDLGPWTPKYEDGRLYGRGGADDGYAVYASLTAIMALDQQGIARPRCVGLIETCEESGSFDLPAYIELLKDRLGQVSLVVCLDSGAGNYEQLWLTTSLRGMVSGVLKVEVLTEGIHSGEGSGVVPSSFRVLRQLLDRLEDNAPYNAMVTIVPDGRAGAYGATGWNTPELSPWLSAAVNAASLAHFGAPVGYVGQGGTIPLMSMLQNCFPAAQMMVCGVLGPKSNAHGPNEFLHVPYGKRLTAAVAQVMAAHP